MQPRVLLLVMIFGLVPSWNGSAQERAPAGEISAFPLRVEVKGNRAKFNEYRDLRDGIHGRIDLRYDAEGNYLDFRADDIGYRDQKYELNGGRRGSFRYHLGYDGIPHDFTLGNSPSIRGKTFVR